MIAIGSDHGGYALKQHIIEVFEKKGFTFTDYGTDSSESCDYPIFGFRVAEAVRDHKADCGIVICSTGIGISIAANKVKGIRCAHCTDPFSAKMCRRHNDANVLALGAKITGVSIAEEIVENFLQEEFEGGRHQRRVQLINDYNEGE